MNHPDHEKVVPEYVTLKYFTFNSAERKMYPLSSVH